jgi:hypothetical protein
VPASRPGRIDGGVVQFVFGEGEGYSASVEGVEPAPHRVTLPEPAPFAYASGAEQPAR